jgi:hypothetical protein
MTSVGLLAVALRTAAAAFAAPSLTGVLACRSVADGAARLACYDREIDAFDAASAPAAARAVPPLSTAGAAASAVPAAPSAPAAPSKLAAPSAPVAPAAPVLNAQEKFGLPEGKVAAQEVAAGTRAADASQIEAHLVRVAPAADARLVFTLDNKQVWWQNQADGQELLAKVGDAVTIHRGVLGSYWMQFPSGRGCKVSRLQ